MDGSFRRHRSGGQLAEQDLWAAERAIWLAGREALRARLDPECVLAAPDPWNVLAEDQTVADCEDDHAGWAEVSLKEPALSRPRSGVAALSYRARGVREGLVCEALCRSTYIQHSDGWRLVHHTRDVVWRAATAS